MYTNDIAASGLLRGFGRLVQISSMFAVAAAAGASVVLDAPGHAAAEFSSVSASGGEPGAEWALVDWRGLELLR